MFLSHLSEMMNVPLTGKLSLYEPGGFFSLFFLNYNFIEHQMYSFCLSCGLMNSLPINDTKDFSVV